MNSQRNPMLLTLYLVAFCHLFHYSNCWVCDHGLRTKQACLNVKLHSRRRNLITSANVIASEIDGSVATPDVASIQRKKSGKASISKAWLRRYDELKHFQQENDHCNVPRKEKSLGNWVQKQRSAYKLYILKTEGSYENSNEGDYASYSRYQSPLNEHQIQLLNEIGFIWDIHKWRFQSNLQSLQIYYKENDHIEIPSTSKGDSKVLYKWICRQKEEYQNYLNGSESSLTTERRQALEELGFHIGMFDNISHTMTSPAKTRTFIRKSWEGRYQELIEFKNTYGHCRVPTQDDSFIKLSSWVQHQRAEKKKKDNEKKSRLSDEREKLLNEIGFVWNIQSETWNKRLNELKQFKAEHGHVRVHTKQGKLGSWVMIQRLQYGLRQKDEKSTLCDERMKALDEVGFEWDIHEISWEEKYNELRSYKQRENDHLDEISPHLKSWIAAQRAEKRYKKQGLQSHLTDERELKLNHIGFDWNADEARFSRRHTFWMEKFEKLKKWKEEHDTCRVPVKKSHTKEEKSFTHWVRDQRRYYKAHVNGISAPMTYDRRQLLESIGFADDIVL